MKTSRSSSGLAFTLIELIAVVLIIGILMALVLPTIIKSIRDAEKVETKKEVVDIERAISSYVSRYGSFPAVEGVVSGGAFAATDPSYPFVGPNRVIFNNLTGTNDVARALTGAYRGSPHLNNSQLVVFINLDEERYFPNAVGYVDRWGEEYGIALDVSGDNNVDLTYIYKVNDTATKQRFTAKVEKRKVCVWSNGDPSDENSSLPRNHPKRRSFITSWQ